MTILFDATRPVKAPADFGEGLLDPPDTYPDETPELPIWDDFDPAELVDPELDLIDVDAAWHRAASDCLLSPEFVGWFAKTWIGGHPAQEDY